MVTQSDTCMDSRAEKSFDATPLQLAPREKYAVTVAFAGIAHVNALESVRANNFTIWEFFILHFLVVSYDGVVDNFECPVVMNAIRVRVTAPIVLSQWRYPKN